MTPTLICHPLEPNRYVILARGSRGGIRGIRVLYGILLLTMEAGLDFALSHSRTGPFCLRGLDCSNIYLENVSFDHLKWNSIMLTQHNSLAGQNQRGQVWFTEVGVVTAHSFAGEWMPY